MTVAQRRQSSTSQLPVPARESGDVAVAPLDCPRRSTLDLLDRSLARVYEHADIRGVSYRRLSVASRPAIPREPAPGGVLPVVLAEGWKTSPHDPPRLAVVPHWVLATLFWIATSTWLPADDGVVRSEPIQLIESEEATADSALTLNRWHVRRFLSPAPPVKAGRRRACRVIPPGAGVIATCVSPPRQGRPE
jgi:hypothetical protein